MLDPMHMVRRSPVSTRYGLNADMSSNWSRAESGSVQRIQGLTSPDSLSHDALLM